MMSGYRARVPAAWSHLRHLVQLSSGKKFLRWYWCPTPRHRLHLLRESIEGGHDYVGISSTPETTRLTTLNHSTSIFQRSISTLDQAHKGMSQNIAVRRASRSRWALMVDPKNQGLNGSPGWRKRSCDYRYVQISTPSSTNVAFHFPPSTE